jgi:hypothetical protein
LEVALRLADRAFNGGSFVVGGKDQADQGPAVFVQRTILAGSGDNFRNREGYSPTSDNIRQGFP